MAGFIGQKSCVLSLMRRAWESLGKLGNITDHGVSQGFLRCHEGSLPVTSYHYLSQAINRQGPFPRLHQVSLHFLTPRYIPFLSSRLPFLRIPDVSRHRLEHLFQVIGRVPHLGCDRPTIVLCFPSSSYGFLNVAKQTRHNK